MKISNTRRTLVSLLSPFGLCALILVTALMGIPVTPAYAVNSSDKYAEVDALTQRLDALQTDLNQANADLADAQKSYNEATQKMKEAQARVTAAEDKIKVLQERLGQRAQSMYRSGPTTFLDVILGATSFDEFVSSWDMVERITGQDAALVQETKDLRAEAEAARAEYAAQQERAADEVRKASEARITITTTQANLQAQISSISAEAALLAAEEAAAEAAAAHAHDSSNSGSSGPGDSVISGSGILTHPCPSGYVSSGFGMRDGVMHKGVDFAAPQGTPYYAAESGTVMYATNNGGYNGGAGNWVVIAHGNGMITRYMHSSAVYVTPGQYVTRGQNIGAVGNTGDSYGAHLHFEVEISGSCKNPLSYI